MNWILLSLTKYLTYPLNFLGWKTKWIINYGISGNYSIDFLCEFWFWNINNCV